MKARIAGREIDLDVAVVGGKGRVRGGVSEPGGIGTICKGRSDIQPAMSSGSRVGNPAPAPLSTDPEPLIVVVRGAPVAYVRQTQRDRWKKRPCVLRYRAWCDAIRKAAGQRKDEWLHPLTLAIRAYLPIPPSWSERTKALAVGQPHRCKPDGDNLIKAVADALIANDQVIWRGSWEKYWDDGQGPRLELIIQSHRDPHVAVWP